MIYQPLCLDDPPYHIGFRYTEKYPEHKHPEIELFYCTKGSYNIIIDKKNYLMHEGELAVIGSMISHELPDTNHQFDSSCLVIGAGPVMLGNFFDIIATNSFNFPIFNLKTPAYKEMYNLMCEIQKYREETNAKKASQLKIRGNIYLLFAFILENMLENNSSKSREVVSVVNIERALENIHTNYANKITVEDVASECGYSKTAFCTVFKNLTGKTFHSALNDHRVKVACTLLGKTDLSIENVACQTGFSDSKSFCRVFKRTMGISPGKFKNNTTNITTD